MFNALFLEDTGGVPEASVRWINASQLPKGDVLVSVLYSSLNYKDGLAVTGKGKIIRGAYPFIPGIDLAGVVEESDSAAYKCGDVVIGTGWGLGERHWGGYAQKQRVRAEWLLPMPEGLSPLEAMMFGTAGLTAMLACMSLESHGITPARGDILVTGASGGVGSIAIAILAALGYQVAASTGTQNAHDWLRSLGAAHIIHRSELSETKSRPLESERWAGAVDAVGGSTLASILSSLCRHGCVAVCGNAGGHELQTTVFPFILRGVSMIGIDSNTCPVPLRREAWSRLGRITPHDVLQERLEVISLKQVQEMSRKIVSGDIQGRIVVDVNA